MEDRKYILKNADYLLCTLNNFTTTSTITNAALHTVACSTEKYNKNYWQIRTQVKNNQHIQLQTHVKNNRPKIN